MDVDFASLEGELQRVCRQEAIRFGVDWERVWVLFREFFNSYAIDSRFWDLVEKLGLSAGKGDDGRISWFDFFLLRVKHFFVRGDNPMAVALRSYVQDLITKKNFILTLADLSEFIGVTADNFYQLNLVLHLMGYFLYPVEMKKLFLWREKYFWVNTNCLGLSNFDRVLLGYLERYRRQDEAINKEHFIGYCRGRGLELGLGDIERFLDLFWWESGYRFPFQLLGRQKQLLRLFREMGRPLTIDEIMEELERRGVAVKRQYIGTALATYKNSFSSIGSRGLWGLKEWTELDRRTKVQLICDVLRQAERPLSRDELLLELRRIMPDTDWVGQIMALLVNRPHLFAGVNIGGQRYWVLAERRAEFGQYQDWQKVPNEQKVASLVDTLNRAVRERVRPGGVVRFSLQELMDVVSNNPLQDTAKNRYIRQVRGGRRFKQGRQVFFEIPYRQDGQYWAMPKRDTIRGDIEQLVRAILRQLPPGKWMQKKNLYEEVNNVYPCKIHTFYAYLLGMEDVEVERQGKNWFCRLRCEQQINSCTSK